jgi:uncharacterized membrane protein
VALEQPVSVGFGNDSHSAWKWPIDSSPRPAQRCRTHPGPTGFMRGQTGALRPPLPPMKAGISSAASPTSAAVATTAPPSPKPDRIESVDLLRGFVMLLMALDHTRAYLHWGALHGFGPLDLQTTTVPVFLTRWITHFCAPVFIFLAGTGAFLSTTRGKTKRELSRFLVTRGAWLVLLDLTVIHWFGWAFKIDLHTYLGIVIWAIGWSMIVLSALVHLPLWAIASVGIATIAGHNALDRINPADFGPLEWLWRVLHIFGPIEFAPGYRLIIGYPLVPWIGVMAVGYAFGHILLRERDARRRWVLRAGVILTVAFVLLRFSNLYGNPSPWTPQARPGFTLLAFLDTAKYPPSLLYLMMTLGPALVVLALLDRPATPAALRPALVFGRVPMFYYLLHLPLIHVLALLIETVRFGEAPWLFGLPFDKRVVPPDAGMGLPGVYAIAVLALALLYPVCRWFAEYKRRSRATWVSYL